MKEPTKYLHYIYFLTMDQR